MSAGRAWAAGIWTRFRTRGRTRASPARPRSGRRPGPPRTATARRRWRPWARSPTRGGRRAAPSRDGPCVPGSFLMDSVMGEGFGQHGVVAWAQRPALELPGEGRPPEPADADERRDPRPEPEDVRRVQGR